MRLAILFLLSAVFSFAQTNRFHISQHPGSNGELVLIKTDLSTGKSWRYDDSFQGTEIVTSEAGQKLKQRLEKIVIDRLNPLNGFYLSEAVEYLSNRIAHSDPENSPKEDAAKKGSNNNKKNQSGVIRAIVPKGNPEGGAATNKPPIMIPGAIAPGLPGGIGTIPPNPRVDPTTGVPAIPSTPSVIPGVPAGGGIPGGGLPGMIPGGVPGGGHIKPQLGLPTAPAADPPSFPIFILSGVRSRYAIASPFVPGVDPMTGLPVGPAGGGIPGGGAVGVPPLNPITGLPAVSNGKPKAEKSDDNKTDTAIPPGLPPGVPPAVPSGGVGVPGMAAPGLGGGVPVGGGGLPGTNSGALTGVDPVTGLPVGGGLPGMAAPGLGGGVPVGGGGLPGMGGGPLEEPGVDPELVMIRGIRRPLSGISAYGALHLVLSFSDVPLHCAIDQHGVFIFPPNEPFRFLNGQKPKFNKTGRWIELSDTE